MNDLQEGIYAGDDLAQAIDSGRCYATCSSPSVHGRSFGFDLGHAGRIYVVASMDTMSGIPQSLLGLQGRLTGRYVVPTGCSRKAARWECRIPGRNYIWIEIEE